MISKAFSAWAGPASRAAVKASRIKSLRFIFLPERAKLPLGRRAIDYGTQDSVSDRIVLCLAGGCAVAGAGPGEPRGAVRGRHAVRPRRRHARARLRLQRSRGLCVSQ